MTEVRKLMKSKPSGQICLKVGLNQLPKRDESPLPAERAQGAPSSQSHTSRWWQHSAGLAPCIRMRHVSAGCPYGLQGRKKNTKQTGKNSHFGIVERFLHGKCAGGASMWVCACVCACTHFCLRKSRLRSCSPTQCWVLAIATRHNHRPVCVVPSTQLKPGALCKEDFVLLISTKPSSFSCLPKECANTEQESHTVLSAAMGNAITCPAH